MRAAAARPHVLSVVAAARAAALAAEQLVRRAQPPALRRALKHRLVQRGALGVRGALDILLGVAEGAEAPGCRRQGAAADRRTRRRLAALDPDAAAAVDGVVHAAGQVGAPASNALFC